MKKRLTILFVLVGFTFLSCSRRCRCEEDWDAGLTYVEGDLVWHDSKCWRASAQGKGIEPGPFMEDGNDIWHECLKK